MTQTTNLESLAEIKSGITEKVELHAYPIKVIRMKNIDHKNARLNNEPLDTVNMGLPMSRKLKLNDIIVVAKGERNTAVKINDVSETMAATNHFFVVSIRPGEAHKIDPGYLAWYLNNPAKTHFEQHATGATIRNITKEALHKLEVKIPSLEVQRTIVEIMETMNHEQQVFDQLQEQRRHLLNHLFEA